MPATLDSTETQLVAALARGAVAQTAPGELALFPITSAAYFQNPGRTVAWPRGGDAALGFGAEVAVAVAPVALAVATEVAKWLLGELREALKSEGTAAIKRAAERLAQRLVPGSAPATPPARPAPTTPTFTPHQLADLRARAADRARQLGLSLPKAEQMADAMIAAIATAGA